MKKFNPLQRNATNTKKYSSSEETSTMQYAWKDH